MPFRVGTSGFGILAVLVMMSLLSLGSVYFAAQLRRAGQNMKNLRNIQNRDELLERLGAVAGLGSALAKTHSQNDPRNSAFNLCLSGTTADACAHGRWHELNLYDSFGRRVAGTRSPDGVMRYRGDGGDCPASEIGCPLEAYTDFRAICPGNTASCRTFDAIEVRFSLAQAVSAATPGAFPLKTLRGLATVGYGAVFPPVPPSPGVDQKCTAGEFQIGTTADGQSVCQAFPSCSGGFLTGIDSQYKPVCASAPALPQGKVAVSPHTCAANEVMIGVDGNGKVLCRAQAPIPQTLVQCGSGDYLSGVDFRASPPKAICKVLPSSTPPVAGSPTVAPSSSFGGSYFAAVKGSSAAALYENKCLDSNKLTGLCTCPEGYEKKQVFHWVGYCGTPSDPACGWWDTRRIGEWGGATGILCVQ